MAQILNPLTLPLQGKGLIEASAGTGKTYTLAALYIRLLLGHQIPAPLGVEQILVVTFTEAATMELRERIRSRIRDAREDFCEEAVMTLCYGRCWRNCLNTAVAQVCLKVPPPRWTKPLSLRFTGFASACYINMRLKAARCFIKR